VYFLIISLETTRHDENSVVTCHRIVSANH